MRWSIFCRVVDNFGDVGFAWRLAADLATRGESVCLAVDDASALAWMAPRGARGVEVVAWDGDIAASGDVLVETFGCGFPTEVEAALAIATRRPVCINIEHMSAEPYVERSHALPSPRLSKGGEARTTWFFFPGFTPSTGGLLREPGLLEQRRRFGDGREWLAAKGVVPRDGERCVSVFCYRNPPFAALLDALDASPTLLLLTPGPATEQALALLGPGRQRGALRAACLPALAQPDFDHLLWSCALNFVRGEDSLVRAIWAGAPFVWQIYAQEDGAHAVKLAAFLDRFLSDAPAPLAAEVRDAFAAWNGLGPVPDVFELPDATPWAAHCGAWRDRLSAQGDLVRRLLEFVVSKR